MAFVHSERGTPLDCYLKAEHVVVPLPGDVLDIALEQRRQTAELAVPEHDDKYRVACSE